MIKIQLHIFLILYLFISACQQPQIIDQNLAHLYLEKGIIYERENKLIDAYAQYIQAKKQEDIPRYIIKELNKRFYRLAEKLHKSALSSYMQKDYKNAYIKLIFAFKICPVHPKIVKGHYFHKIQQNDTLWSVAKQYYDDSKIYPIIVEYNSLRSKTDIKSGKILKIPIINGFICKKNQNSDDLFSLNDNKIEYIDQFKIDEADLNAYTINNNNINLKTSTQNKDENKTGNKDKADIKNNVTKKSDITKDKIDKKAVQKSKNKKINDKSKVSSVKLLRKKVKKDKKGKLIISDYKYNDQNKNNKPIKKILKKNHSNENNKIKNKKILQANKLFDAGKYLEAKQLFLEVKDKKYKKYCELYVKKCDHAYTFFSNGIKLFKNGDYLQSIKEFQKVVHINPKDEVAYDYIDKFNLYNYNVHFHEGNSLFNKGLYELARLEYIAALNFNNDCRECEVNIRKCETLFNLYLQGKNFFDNAQYKNAINAFSRIVSIHKYNENVNKLLKESYNRYQENAKSRY